MPPVATRSKDRGRGSFWLWRKLLKIDDAEVEPKGRGFSLQVPGCVDRIRQVGRSFLDGYHAALETAEVDDLVVRLDRMPNDLRGFAYEGAAMGVALLDSLTPWRPDRFSEFVRKGDQHLYMLYVGMGWAAARLPGCPERVTKKHDSLYSWLALDGYGFHEGFFHHPRYLGTARRPRHLSESGRRVFDQGLGRSLWFIFGSEAERIAGAIGDLDSARRADLWSGVGLACAYAGGCGRENVERIRELAAEYGAELAQGSSFGAKARQRAGNLNEHTEMVCEVICRTSAAEAAAITDEVLATIDRAEGGRAYEAWRQGIMNCFRKEQNNG